jgi:hypothetical protein
MTFLSCNSDTAAFNFPRSILDLESKPGQKEHLAGQNPEA